MEISIAFDAPPEDIAPWDEYGYIQISGNRGTVSSKEKRVQIMAFPFLQQLLGSLTILLQTRKQFDKTFVGDGSSDFYVRFQLLKGSVVVSSDNRVVDVVSAQQCYQDVCNSLRKIALEYWDKLDPDVNVICKDLLEQIRSLESA